MVSPASGSRTRILCVAKRPQALEILRAEIKRAGYDFLTAVTADKAVAICIADQIAAVVLDAELLILGEYSVAETLKAIRPSLRIFVLQPEDQTALCTDLPAGVDAVLSIDPQEQLTDTLKKLVGTPAVRSAQISR